MSETPPGTDRVELTDAEYDQLSDALKLEPPTPDAPMYYVGGIDDVVASIVAARLQALDDRYRKQVNLNGRLSFDLYAARAELASANARCAEAQALAFKWLDYGEDTVEYRLGETLHSALSTPASPVTNTACDPTICCGAGTDCAAFAELHAEVEKWRTKYQQMMVSPRAEADELARRVDAGQKMEDTALDRASELRADRDALQATLDRVTALADEWDAEAKSWTEQAEACYEGTESRSKRLALASKYSTQAAKVRAAIDGPGDTAPLRAALTPEGTE